MCDDKKYKIKNSNFFIIVNLVFLMMMFNSILLYMLIILSVLSVIEFIQITKKIFKNTQIITQFNFYFYLSIFCFLFFLFKFCSIKKYFTYYYLGVLHQIRRLLSRQSSQRSKLTKISPNKTYSGAIGSILLTCITVSVLTICYYVFIHSVDHVNFNFNRLSNW